MIAVTLRYPNVAAATYDQVVASLELDANPPAGAVLHMAGQGDGDMVVTEIWRTEQTFRAFFDYRLRPALRQHGVESEPLVDIRPLHNLWSVEMDTIERMGAVSLPATYAGAAL
jgi:hypothetical protein